MGFLLLVVNIWNGRGGREEGAWMSSYGNEASSSSWNAQTAKDADGEKSLPTLIFCTHSSLSSVCHRAQSKEEVFQLRKNDIVKMKAISNPQLEALC